METKYGFFFNSMSKADSEDKIIALLDTMVESNIPFTKMSKVEFLRLVPNLKDLARFHFNNYKKSYYEALPQKIKKDIAIEEAMFYIETQTPKITIDGVKCFFDNFPIKWNEYRFGVLKEKLNENKDLPIDVKKAVVEEMNARRMEYLHLNKDKETPIQKAPKRNYKKEPYIRFISTPMK